LSARCELCAESLLDTDLLRCSRCQSSDFKLESSLLSAPFYLFKGLFLLFRTPELLRLALIPLLLSGLVLVLILFLGLNWVFSGLNLWLTQVFQNYQGLFVLKGMTLAFASLSMAVLFLFLYLPVSSLFSLPFLDKISQKTEDICLGIPASAPKALPLSFMLKEMIALLGLKMVILLLGLPLILIPVLGFSLYLYLLGILTALDFIDLMLSRKGYSLPEKWAFFKANALRLCLFSLPVLPMAWIPILQLLILPGASVAGVFFILNTPKLSAK
jgi:CysZ protein